MKTVRIVICGPRSLTNQAFAERAFDAHLSRFIGRDVIVSTGNAVGVDRMGKAWALRQGWPVFDYDPDYARYGRFMAPKVRNIAMGRIAADPDYEGLVLALWDGYSGGTAHMIAVATALRIETVIVVYDPKKLEPA